MFDKRGGSVTEVAMAQGNDCSESMCARGVAFRVAGRTQAFARIAKHRVCRVGKEFLAVS